MLGFGEPNGPTYISSHSADVILSDVRPFKLKSDALRCINVFLDDFLHNVLSSAGSLMTDRLRASLLGLLPTSLGKEALLEAEVELRAYWERMTPAGIMPVLEDDSTTFHLPWAFELLRNKCEAYSTLNEADEDPVAEARINEKYNGQASPPQPLLLAPAALYLTAILEAVCEHVLTNVSRVAARDSSRTSATTSDLFTALCEDASVYGYFRTTKVYNQIEQLSKAASGPKSRRSKSFSRSDKTTGSSPHHEPSKHSISGSLSRQPSVDTSATAAPSQRSSFDKSRALRMFTNGKGSMSSLEKEEHQGGSHRRTSSVVSEGKASEYVPEEDAAMLEEFDDLMRSASTMKMSLTPDRLKTMEIYKQEKAQRGAKRPTAVSFKPEADAQPIVPSRSSSSRPTLRRVDSIIEDEEESPNKHRPRQSSHAAVPNAMSALAMNPVRSRSISTSGAGAHPLPRKSSRPLNGNVPSSFPNKAGALTGSHSASNLKTSYAQNGRPMGMNDNGMPARTRIKQRNRESLDLDDIMGGSDDDTPPEPPAPVPQSRGPSTPTSPNSSVKRPAVSAATRDLMDFLADGPPEPRGPPVNREGKQLLDFLNDGPPNYAPSPAVASPGDGKSRTGRLQRMISKLNIGEKAKSSEPPLKTPTYQSQGRSAAPQIPGAPNPLGSLANRPIPPRPPKPPQPISPPDSPSQRSLDEVNKSLPRKASTSHERGPSVDYHSATPSPLAVQTHLPSQAKDIPSPRIVPYTNGHGVVDHGKDASAHDAFVSPVRSPTIHRKPVPPVSPTAINPQAPHHQPSPPPSSPPPASNRPSGPAISHDEARDMQRLIANATTAEECRLIVDMFLTRAGIPRVEPAFHSKAPSSETDGPYPSPPPSMNKYPLSPVDSVIENTVVDMLLGQSGTQTPPRPPRRRTAKSPDSHYPADALAQPEERMDKTTIPIMRKPAPEYMN
ncbi:hypothetical protein BKA70DRAFT_1257090 [Coprinopsis sp. MPI-PUGE-AT-0042]|nr:hypothetical protein BKA70DRAFT_1257090 [Coprinopsis sp. MPI-PUGE-AT-0042]